MAIGGRLEDSVYIKCVLNVSFILICQPPASGVLANKVTCPPGTIFTPDYPW